MISSHVLDTALGCPAFGIAVHLDLLEPGENWRRLATGVTDRDGRVSGLFDAGPLGGRTCRLCFETGAYFQKSARVTFFPEVQLIFSLTEGVSRYHIPLLLSPFSYSAYRGS
jgi:5-hydroxyisourate hydrolase